MLELPRCQEKYTKIVDGLPSRVKFYSVRSPDPLFKGEIIKSGCLMGYMC